MVRSLGSLTECAAMRPRSPFIPLDRLGASPPTPTLRSGLRNRCVKLSWLNTFIAVLWKCVQEIVVKVLVTVTCNNL